MEQGGPYRTCTRGDPAGAMLVGLLPLSLGDQGLISISASVLPNFPASNFLMPASGQSLYSISVSTLCNELCLMPQILFTLSKQGTS